MHKIIEYLMFAYLSTVAIFSAEARTTKESDDLAHKIRHITVTDTEMTNVKQLALLLGATQTALRIDSPSEGYEQAIFMTNQDCVQVTVTKFLPESFISIEVRASEIRKLDEECHKNNFQLLKDNINLKFISWYKIKNKESFRNYGRISRLEIIYEDGNFKYLELIVAKKNSECAEQKPRLLAKKIDAEINKIISERSTGIDFNKIEKNKNICATIYSYSTEELDWVEITPSVISEKIWEASEIKKEISNGALNTEEQDNIGSLDYKISNIERQVKSYYHKENHSILVTHNNKFVYKLIIRIGKNGNN